MDDVRGPLLPLKQGDNSQQDGCEEQQGRREKARDILLKVEVEQTYEARKRLGSNEVDLQTAPYAGQNKKKSHGSQKASNG